MTTLPTTALRRVLIADDSADDREMVLRAMPSGFLPREASTEAEASAIIENEDIYLAFVDVFFEDGNQRALGLALGERLAERIPVIYFSDKEDRTQEALGRTKTKRYRFLDKNRDFSDRIALGRVMTEAAADYYGDLEIAFPGSHTSWGNIAAKLDMEGTSASHAAAELEFSLLIRAATKGWDESVSEAVRACRIELTPMNDSGDNTVVLKMRPFSRRGDAQADVVLKLTRIAQRLDRADRDGHDDHTQFNRYKNIIGGFGLRERRHARRCHFQAQVYSVPYFELDETRTFADYYRREGTDEDDLRRVEDLTSYLFDNALKPLNDRILSGDETLALAAYYGTRIKAPRRYEAIQDSLTRETRPAALRISDESIVVQVAERTLTLRNPSAPVLRDRAYKCATDAVRTQLRHGDFHTGNVLVDDKRRCCWYLDYESMDECHFHLVDHIEFEADILFALLNLDQNFELFVTFVDAITQPQLDAIGDIGASRHGVRHVAEARKAIAAVRAIRRSARGAMVPGGVRSYYHGLMYEALRVAGKASLKQNQRWRALVAAAVIFDKLETVYAHA